MGKFLSRLAPCLKCLKCLKKASNEYEFHQKVADVAAMISPQESDDFKNAFDEVADQDGEVDAYQLREALNKAFQQGIVNYGVA